MNVFILGCGRSGTSLVAGLFRNSGFYMGDSFYKKRESNPLGFFEDRTVNSINEEILKPYMPTRFSMDGIDYGSNIPSDGQRWLARIPVGQDVEGAEFQIHRIHQLISKAPFCFKDPRFCYTLDVWRKEVTNAKYICVFRNPGDVVTSILKEIRSTSYLYNFSLSVDQAFETWRLMYEHVLIKHSKVGDWLFVYYEDLFSMDKLKDIEDFVNRPIDKTFPRLDLNRSKSEYILDVKTQEIFEVLCNRINK